MLLGSTGTASNAPDEPWGVIIIFGFLVGADLILIAAAIYGTVRSRFEYSTGRSTGLALRNASKATFISGVLLAVAGVVLELSDLLSAMESDRHLGSLDAGFLLVCVMFSMSGLNVYAWGRALMNLKMLKLDVMVFYVLSGFSMLINLAAMFVTISDAMQRASLSDGTVLIFEGISCALLVRAMVAVGSAMTEKRRERINY